MRVGVGVGVRVRVRVRVVKRIAARRAGAIRTTLVLKIQELGGEKLHIYHDTSD